VGTRERRLREVEKRRSDILHAAKTLFWARGYEKTTMPEIAQAAELAPGTLYLYFPRKSAIYTELLVEGYEILSRDLADVLKRASTPRDRAVALIDGFLAFAKESPEYFAIIFFILQQEGTDWEGVTGEQLQRLHAMESQCKDLVASVLRQTPYVPAKQDLADVDAIWCMLVGIVFFFGRHPSFPRVAEEARTILLRAVLGGDTPSQPTPNPRRSTS